MCLFRFLSYARCDHKTECWFACKNAKVSKIDCTKERWSRQEIQRPMKCPECWAEDHKGMKLGDDLKWTFEPYDEKEYGFCLICYGKSRVDYFKIFFPEWVGNGVEKPAANQGQ